MTVIISRLKISTNFIHDRGIQTQQGLLQTISSNKIRHCASHQNQNCLLIDLFFAFSSYFLIWNFTSQTETSFPYVFLQGGEFRLLIKPPPQNYLLILSVLTAAGLIGNILAFCVLCSPVYSRKSYSYYLKALAIFDSLTLIITGKLRKFFCKIFPLKRVACVHIFSVQNKFKVSPVSLLVFVHFGQ